MPPSRKKVLVRTLGNAIHAGYLPLSGFLSDHPPYTVDLLDLSARILPVLLDEIRTIAFVRDFNRNDPQTPESLTRRAFLARPRTEGLWLRVTFAPGDTLEGLAPLDVSVLDALLLDRGLFLIPPDIRSNTQRVFIPRTAIAELQLLAVITTPSRPRSAGPKLDLQLDLPHPEAEEIG